MSWAVEDWVWRRCTVDDRLHREVLLAVAWHADAAGLTSQGPSFDTLEEMVRQDRKRVMAVVDALEEATELLVWRAAADHRGRRPPNRYAVVMGRDPHAVRRLVEAPRHRTLASLDAGTDQHPGTDQEAATARQSRRAAPSVPSRSTFGGASVALRSSGERAGGLGLGTGLGPGRASAARSSPARAHDPDPRLEPLRRELDFPKVSWQMTQEQTESMVALLAVHGTTPLVAAALARIDASGLPTFARAWLGEWRELPVPGAAVLTRDVPAPRQDAGWCGSCESAGFRFVVDEDKNPLYPCPRCHPTSTTEAPF